MGVEYLNNKAFEKIIKEFQISKREKLKYEMILEDLEGSKERREKRHARNKKRGEQILVQIRQKRQEYDGVFASFSQSQNDLAMAFYTLSENIVRYAKFQFIDDDDAIQEAVVICFEKVDRFDPVKGKAFNYMTTCIFNHFRQLYRTAKNYRDLKDKYLRYLQSELDKVIIQNGRLHSLTNQIIPVENCRQRM